MQAILVTEKRKNCLRCGNFLCWIAFCCEICVLARRSVWIGGCFVGLMKKRCLVCFIGLQGLIKTRGKIWVWWIFCVLCKFEEILNLCAEWSKKCYTFWTKNSTVLLSFLLNFFLHWETKRNFLPWRTKRNFLSWGTNRIFLLQCLPFFRVTLCMLQKCVKILCLIEVRYLRDVFCIRKFKKTIICGY